MECRKKIMKENIFPNNQSSSNLTQEFLNNCFEFWSVCPPSFFGRKYDHFFSTHPLAFGKMPSHHDWTLSLFSRATSAQWGHIIIEVALWFVPLTSRRAFWPGENHKHFKKRKLIMYVWNINLFSSLLFCYKN